jgi:2-polyprenyl-6-methoxyphenol hydroxylase-like FAD-dependent oxidoreductase
MMDILIVGAGPTGLTAAVEAKRQGLTARIIERKSERQTTQSRAIVVHSRIMELMSTFSGGTLTNELQQAGIQMESIDVYFNRQQTPSSNLYIGKEAHWGDAEVPFMLFLPQYDTENLLEDELRRQGLEVEWSKSLTSIQQDEHFVVSTISYCL